MSAARQLPPLQQLLERRPVRALGNRLRREILLALAREAIEQERVFLLRGRQLKERYGSDEPDRASLLLRLERSVVEAALALLTPRQRTVINATGVVLHTNLGRALLSEAAIAELARVARNPVALEIDLASGERDSRHRRVERWLQLLTGAEAALAVNNGAAALWLAVQALGARRRVLISRGEQVAIGGSFRMPELLASTRGKLIEIGTTNKTKLEDYRRWLRPGDLALKVHPSNYRVEGYVDSVELEQLAALCERVGARLIFDAGSGSLYNFAQFGLKGEQTVQASLRSGAHLVTFSGDKLLGGPQAGLAVGRADLIAKMAGHPMQRALRCDKLVLAALEATLAAHGAADGRPDLPLLDCLGTPLARLRSRARAIAEGLAVALPTGWSCSVRRSEAAIGGGSFAGEGVPSVALVLNAPSDRAARSLHERLRHGVPAVLARLSSGALQIDFRTIRESELPQLKDRLHESCAAGGEP